MDYVTISELAARQVIDATAVFEEFERSKAEARRYSGGMYWKRQGAYEYLVKTYPDNRQSRLGPKSAETEQTYEQFTAAKQKAEARFKFLKSTLVDMERMNKAVKAGRVPSLVVKVLQAIEDAGLSEHFVVVGTHALYAYETAAGVHIAAGAMATRDVDLLWDARRRVRFISDMAKLDQSMLAVLRQAEPSFVRKEGQAETAITSTGFEVDFLRRMPEGDDPHPVRFTADEDDLWPVQAPRAGVLTGAPRFEQVVISVTGQMARMRTISPESFVEFKRWMADKAPQRDPKKRRRDKMQADIVESLLREGLLVSRT